MTTFTNNENRARLKDAIEKPITRIDSSAGTEPARILGTPMLRAPTIPNGVVQGPAITSAVSADLKKLTPSLAAGVRQVAGRK
jgi:hypothetical protein